MLDYADSDGIASWYSSLYGYKATLRVSLSEHGSVLPPPGESASSGLFISEEDFSRVVTGLRNGKCPKDILEGIIEKYDVRKKLVKR